MNALAFLEKHGRDLTEQVAKKAGTNMAYFSQIAHGHRRPSIDLAKNLVAASEELVPDQDARLDLLALLDAKAAA